MTLSEINRNPDQRTLRQFAVLWILFFGGLAAAKFAKQGWTPPVVVLAALAATAGPLGLIAPRVLRPVFAGWMMLAFPIGWLVSHVVLALLFYLVFLPIGLVFRLTGRDALRLKPYRAASYWQEKPEVRDPARYFRQF